VLGCPRARSTETERLGDAALEAFGHAGGRLRPQSPEEVAEVLAGLLDAPRAEIFTNPAHPDIQKRYYTDVEAYEASLGAPPAPQPIS
jgi:hypothetical protein